MPLAGQEPQAQVGDGASTNTLVRLDEAKAVEPVATIEVPYDPVYQQRKRYVGVSVEAFLRDRRIRIPDSSGTVVEFTCQDGYRTVIPMALLFRQGAFLATADADAAVDEKWLPVPGAAARATPGPYYLVWQRDPGEGHFWPYQITTLRIEQAAAALQLAAPAPTVRLTKGFELFQRNCMSCHSINGVGGSVGVELNVPRNVFEYWRPRELAAYVSNPASFRAHSKMPSFRALGAENIALILEYVHHMKSRKTKG